MNKPITFQNSISNEEAALLPAIEFRGPIVVVDSEPRLREACRYLAAQPVIGFDTETRPSFRAGVVNRVALLQLSSPEQSFLFRLCKIPLDKAIVKILENKEILKIGADVKGDLRALHNIRHFQEAGFVDLQELAGEWGIEEKSLRKLSAIVLGQRVSKAQRLSNWEAAQLTDKQQFYAATDAWVCTRIYDRLLHTQTKENEEMIPQIHLRRGKEESLLRRHPWIFSGAIESVRYDGNEIPEGAPRRCLYPFGRLHRPGTLPDRFDRRAGAHLRTGTDRHGLVAADDLHRTRRAPHARAHGCPPTPPATVWFTARGTPCRDSSSIFTTRPP